MHVGGDAEVAEAVVGGLEGGVAPAVYAGECEGEGFHDLQFTSYELRFTSYDLRVMIYELRMWMRMVSMRRMGVRRMRVQRVSLSRPMRGGARMASRKRVRRCMAGEFCGCGVFCACVGWACVLGWVV